MSAPVRNVDDICTDADLVEFIGSENTLRAAQPSTTIRDAKRASAYRDVLEELKKRAPPVYEGDLADVTELRTSVGYLACYRICREARTVMGDRWDALANDMWKEYKGAVSRSFVVGSTVRGPGGGSFSVDRR